MNFRKRVAGLHPTVAILSLLLGFVSASAGAVPIVDQDGLVPDVDNDDSESGFVLAPAGTAQTFTAGLAGLLTRIDIQVRHTENSTSAPLLFDIRRTTSTGTPVEDASGPGVLAAMTFNSSAIPSQPFTLAITTIDLTPFSIFVEAGDVLAVALRSDDPAGYSTAGIFQTYADGSMFFRFDSQFSTGWQQDGFGRDFGFRTFVDTAIQNPNPPTVPEPRTLALFGLGLVGLGFARRKRAA